MSVSVYFVDPKREPAKNPRDSETFMILLFLFNVRPPKSSAKR